MNVPLYRFSAYSTVDFNFLGSPTPSLFAFTTFPMQEEKTIHVGLHKILKKKQKRKTMPVALATLVSVTKVVVKAS